MVNNENKETRLMIAAARGDAAAVAMLASESPEDVAKRDALGRTALMRAAESMNLMSLLLLLPKSEVAAVDDNGEGAMERALAIGWVPGSVALAKRMSEQGCLAGRSGVLLAAAKACAKTDFHGSLIKILAAECDPSEIASGGVTALMFAAHAGASIWVSALAPLSDPWAPSASGWTPLSWAVGGRMGGARVIGGSFDFDEVASPILARLIETAKPLSDVERKAWDMSRQMAKNLKIPKLGARLEKISAIVEGLEIAGAAKPAKAIGSGGQRL